jgi:hypothetical protein
VNPNVRMVLEAISQLDRDELLELRLRLQSLWNEGEGGIGVREPRVPPPESPGDAIALDLEE